MIRSISIFALIVSLAACGVDDLDKPPAPLGNFALGYNAVVAPNLTKGPVSRDATSQEWTAAVKEAIEARFRRYEGDRLYHLGVSVDGYVLAQPGIPLVYTPKSALIVTVTVWDDAEQRKLNAEAHQITVTEAISGKTIIGSGNTQTREEQLANLAASAAKQIERWLVLQNAREGWFEPGDSGGEQITSEAG